MSNIEILLKDLDENNVTSILKVWNDIIKIKKQLEEQEEMLKNKIKVFLKEKNWSKYNDKETGINVSLTIQKREIIDKERLKDIITDQQYAMVLKITSFEKLMILTPEVRKKLGRIIK